MIFIVDKKPGYIEECPFYDHETELCHGDGYKEDPECWDGWKKHLTWVTALILSHFGTSYLL